MDWQKHSGGRNDSSLIGNLLYPQAVSNIKVAAQRLSDFLLWIDKEGFTTPDKIHLTGIPLGAHLAGAASQRFCCHKGGLQIS